jgi:mono/diheme cytochrome c family protein
MHYTAAVEPLGLGRYSKFSKGVNEMNHRGWQLLGAALIVTLALANQGEVAIAKKQHNKIDGAQVFAQNCAQCHLGGGNQAKPAKPVAESTKLKSLVTFKDYLRAPLGHMPYYKHIVTDDKTLKALYNYCRSLKPTKPA